MRVLVLSETDASCGPMAAAFLMDYSPMIEAVSAGRNPLQNIDPMVVAVMKECLADLEGYVPRDEKTIDKTMFDAVYECMEKPCPNTMEAYRCWRDEVKNESFLFYRNLVRKSSDTHDIPASPAASPSNPDGNPQQDRMA